MRRIRLVDSGKERIVTEVTGQTGERLAFDPSYAVRMVADLVPNAWVARGIVGGLLQGLKARGFTDERLGELHGLVVEELRKWLDGERDRMAEAHFRKEVAEGRIQFRLRTDANNWVMPTKTDTYQAEGAEQLPGKDGMPLQRSLFAPVYKGDLRYKQAMLRLMTQAFEIDQTQRVGEMEIVNADGTEVLCDLVLMAEWKTRLPAEFLGSGK
jgi:type III restriction enzyme